MGTVLTMAMTPQRASDEWTCKCGHPYHQHDDGMWPCRGDAEDCLCPGYLAKGALGGRY